MKYLKNIILSIICTLLLVFSGSQLINTKVDTENKQSSFKLTDFDYVVNFPSDDQIDEYKAKKDIIKNVFPVYNYSSKMTHTTNNGAFSSNTSLLMSDDLSNYSISFFNDKTLIEGTFDENKLSLDKKAAYNLGVSVGDKVSFNFAYTKYEYEVGAIYMTSTYHDLDKGLALCKMTDEMKNKVPNKLIYSFAFIDAENDEKCRDYFKHYIPLGNLLSEEEYIAEQKETTKKPQHLTDEEWNNNLKKAYNDYKELYMNADYKSDFAEKAKVMEDVLDQIATTEKDNHVLSIILGILTFVVYTIVSLLFINHDKKNDITAVKNGSPVIKNKMLTYVISTCLISAITIVCLSILGVRNNQFSAVLPVVLMFGLPILVSLLVIVLYIIYVYKKQIGAVKSK